MGNTTAWKTLSTWTKNMQLILPLEIIDQETIFSEPQRFKLWISVCAWCGKDIRLGLHPERAAISHGICKVCEEREMALP